MSDAEGEALCVLEADAVVLGVGAGVPLPDPVGEPEGVPVGEADSVCEAEGVGVALGEGEPLAVPLGEASSVSEAVALPDTVEVPVALKAEVRPIPAKLSLVYPLPPRSLAPRKTGGKARGERGLGARQRH